MKYLLLMATLALSLPFSSACFAEWTEVTKNVHKTTFYVDFDTIKQHQGYVFWWMLFDLGCGL